MFPHYLVKLEMLTAHMYHRVLSLSRETPEFIPPQLWPPNLPDHLTVKFQVKWKTLCLTELLLACTCCCSIRF